MKVFLDTVGCRLNQSEIEAYGQQFRAAGHTLVPTMEEADMMVLNTCAVTAAAASDSRQKIRQAHRAGVGEIVVTGCMSTLRPRHTRRLPGVTKVVPNKEKDRLVGDLLQIEFDDFDLEPMRREAIPGARQRTRAFIKVQDGCDNQCTFCVTTIARGEGRSRPAAEVIADIQGAQEGGAQEVVLTGVHLGSWGYDFERPARLGDLIEKVLAGSDIPRVRVSSLEPWDLEESFFDLWQDRRMCRHLHLPLQSGSGATLARMARKITPAEFAALVEAARERIPGVAITTDIIVGFPGETEDEFEESRAFVERMGFAGAHVFTYSARRGTAAARMPGQVHNFTRKERNAAMREVAARSAETFQAGFLGEEIAVLWESAEPAAESQWALAGLTDNYLKVKAQARQPVWNQITPTRLMAGPGGQLRGEILSYPDGILF